MCPASVVRSQGHAEQVRVALQFPIFSLAMAAIRSGFDLHSLARSGLRDWSREPSG